MKKVYMKLETQKVLNKVSQTVNEQLEHADEIKHDVEKSINHLDKNIRRKSKKVGKQIDKGLTAVKHDVDRALDKITVEMKKPMKALKK